MDLPFAHQGSDRRAITTISRYEDDVAFKKTRQRATAIRSDGLVANSPYAVRTPGLEETGSTWSTVASAAGNRGFLRLSPVHEKRSTERSSERVAEHSL